MDGQFVAALLAVSSLLGVAGIAGAVYANFRSSALEASNTRLTADNDYYLKKIQYLEPKVEALERENNTLRTLVNPAEAIEHLREQEQRNHRETLGLLQQIHEDLRGAR
jgi:hypothetical protein